MAWDHVQYLKFADERTLPARDLLSRVTLEQVQAAVDLGCGPGNSTALLAARWPEAAVTGVDNSAGMLLAARRDLPARVALVEADVSTWRPDSAPDLLFANAVLQWLPDHAALIQDLLGRVRPGGVLAVQMPRNFDQPSHRLMREIHPRPFEAIRPGSPVADPGFYYDLLAPHAATVEIWETVYHHVMADADAIVDWVKGTGLRPFLDRLQPGERPGFLADYRSAIDAAYPPRADGRRLFAFPRLFLVARR